MHKIMMSKTGEGVKIDDTWYKVTEKAAQYVKSGDTISEFSLSQDGKTVTFMKKAKAAGGGGGYQKPSGGYQKTPYNKPSGDSAKKPFVDNSIGMGVGAALNNAVALLIAGKIQENQIPLVVGKLYSLSEKAKSLISEGKIAELLQVEFSLSSVKGSTPQQKKSPEPEPEEPSFEEEDEPNFEEEGEPDFPQEENPFL